MAARKKTTRKGARKKAGASKAPRKRTAKQKASPGRASGRSKVSPTEALARKLVRLTNQPDKIDLDELYAEDCVSREAAGDEVTGIDGVRQKAQFWDSLVASQKWTAQNTFVRPNRICIEWQAKVHLRDGREIELNEVAVHEVRAGKIVAERYYYDPAIMAPPQQLASSDEPTRVLPAADPREAPSVAEELAKAEEERPRGTPPLDPLDL